MADIDPVPVPVDDTEAAPAGAEPAGAGGDAAPQSDVAWILGDTVADHGPAANDMQLPADGHLALDAAAFAEAPANLDHALHQLTTATDLFDVPVLDFDSHHSS